MIYGLEQIVWAAEYHESIAGYIGLCSKWYVSLGQERVQSQNIQRGVGLPIVPCSQPEAWLEASQEVWLA